MTMLTLLTTCLSLLATANGFYVDDRRAKQSVLVDPSTDDNIPVPVTLVVMSRCPDALLCENTFEKVVDKVGHSKIDLSLSFIGTLNSSDSDYGVTCMHGPEECQGNIDELCAKEHFPSSSDWWPFVSCLNYKGRNRIGTEKAAEECAKTTKLDWEGAGAAECAAGKEGRKLLKKSVKYTQDVLNVTTSCTILINGKNRCVRDGTWKQCDNGHLPSDFVRQINSEWDKLNPQ